MTLLKNIGLVPVDIHGHAIPCGGVADLDPADEVVAERVAAGHLTEVQASPIAVVGESGPEAAPSAAEGAAVAPLTTRPRARTQKEH